METIAALYELQAMADGPKLPAPNSNAVTDVVVGVIVAVVIVAITGTIS